MTEAQSGPARGTPLDDYGCIQLDGDDAGPFLQGQLSSDVSQLAAGEGQLSAYNDPQGRVLAVLRLFRTDTGFVAALPAGLADSVTRRLRLFVLRADVVITSPSPWRLLGIQGECPPSDPTAPTLCLPTAEPLWNTLIRGEPSTPAASPDWAALETANGVPEVYPQTSGRFVPQMLRLDDMGAISFTKGCYVGQEVVARAHHLGRIKRHLRLFRCADKGLVPGDEVGSDDIRAGEVARVAGTAGGSIVLAVIKDDCRGPLRARGSALDPLPDPPAFSADDT